MVTINVSYNISSNVQALEVTANNSHNARLLVMTVNDSQLSHISPSVVTVYASSDSQLELQCTVLVVTVIDDQ